MEVLRIIRVYDDWAHKPYRGWWTRRYWTTVVISKFFNLINESQC